MLKFFGQAAAAIEEKLSPGVTRARKLEQSLGETPEAFQAILDNLNQSPSFGVKTIDVLRRVDESLAQTDTRESVLLRARLHDFFTRTGIWYEVGACTNEDFSDGQISARIFSGYLQLLQQGEADILEARVRLDKKWVPTASYVVGLDNMLVTTAQTRSFLYEDWSDADVLRYGRALEKMIVESHGQPEKALVKSCISAPVMARYVRLSALESGALDSGYKILDNLEWSNYMVPVLGAFNGMVDAVKAGVPVQLKGWGILNSDPLFNALKAEDPYFELGRYIGKNTRSDREYRHIRIIGSLDTVFALEDNNQMDQRDSVLRGIADTLNARYAKRWDHQPMVDREHGNDVVNFARAIEPYARLMDSEGGSVNIEPFGPLTGYSDMRLHEVLEKGELKLSPAITFIRPADENVLNEQAIREQMAADLVKDCNRLGLLGKRQEARNPAPMQRAA